MNSKFKNIEDEIWFEQNFQIGELMGYPNCCIKEFCDQPPSLMKNKLPTQNDKKRFKAAHINGVWSGFIPCVKHANLILSKKIKLSDLIKNRSKDLPPFSI